MYEGYLRLSQILFLTPLITSGHSLRAEDKCYEAEGAHNRAKTTRVSNNYVLKLVLMKYTKGRFMQVVIKCVLKIV